MSPLNFACTEQLCLCIFDLSASRTASTITVSRILSLFVLTPQPYETIVCIGGKRKKRSFRLTDLVYLSLNYFLVGAIIFVIAKIAVLLEHLQGNLKSLSYVATRSGQETPPSRLSKPPPFVWRMVWK